MYDSQTGQAVRDSLRSIATSTMPPTDNDLEELHARVCDAVDELHSAGWPVERIIIQLKTLADDAGFARRADPHGSSRERMVARMIQWCLDHYYGPPGSTPGSS